jgi:hypothetical protein
MTGFLVSRGIVVTLPEASLAANRPLFHPCSGGRAPSREAAGRAGIPIVMEHLLANGVH